MPTPEWMLLTAAELRAKAAEDALVIVPVASLEQHGPHLGTGVDIVCGSAVALRTAECMAATGAPVVVTPCVWTGLAEHHMALGGTVSLTYEEFAAVLRGIVRSATRHGFSRVMLLNGHGGNNEAIAQVATEFSRDFGIKVAGGTYWTMLEDAFEPVLERQKGLMHACEAETSLMMHLRPEAVRRENLEQAHGPMTMRVPGQPAGLYRKRSFAVVTESGVIGDARLATAEKGEKLLKIAGERIATMLLNPALWG